MSLGRAAQPTLTEHVGGVLLDESMTITAAADGSSLGNPGPTGWCWYIDDERWAAGGQKKGTNNIGELTAVAELLEASAKAGLAAEELRILCDSKYVIDSVTKWMPGWKRKGWKKADGKPVLNRELLERIDAAMTGRDVTFEWVKGHAGHVENEAADERARAAATAYQSGKEPEVGPGFGGDQSRDAASSEGAPVTAAQAGAPERVADLPVAVLTEDERDDPDGDRFTPADVPAVTDEPGAPYDAETAAPAADAASGHNDPAGARERARDEVEIVSDLTRQLLSGEDVSTEWIDELLHDEFSAVDAQGRSWPRERIVEARRAGVQRDIDRIESDALAPNVALVRCETSDGGGVTAHALTWVNVRMARNERVWQLRFHQSTPIR